MDMLIIAGCVIVLIVVCICVNSARLRKSIRDIESDLDRVDDADQLKARCADLHAQIKALNESTQELSRRCSQLERERKSLLSDIDSITAELDRIKLDLPCAKLNHPCADWEITPKLVQAANALRFFRVDSYNFTGEFVTSKYPVKTDVAKQYYVSLRACNCDYHKHFRPPIPCKHMIRLAMKLRLLDTDGNPIKPCPYIPLR